MKERKNEAVFMAVVVLFWFAQYIYIPYQTTYLTGAGVAASTVGAIVGAYGMAQMILRLPVGVSADRVGRHKPFIMIGALAAGGASLVRVLWCNGVGFLTGNLLSGLASAMWISFMIFYTGKYTGKEQQSATGRIVMFNNLGILMGFTASALLYAKIGMGKICILSVAAGCAAFLLSLLLREPETTGGGYTVRELLCVCKGRQLWMFALVALIQQGVQLTTTMSFTNQILKNAGATDAVVGISSIIYMISAVLFAAFASSEICGKKGQGFWIPVVLCVVAAYCILVPIAGSVPVILVLQILPGMSTGILFSYATSEAMQGIPAEKKSTAMGFFQAVYAIGMTMLPAMTGKIIGISGIQAGYLVLAGIAAAGAAATVMWYRHCPQKRDKNLEIPGKSS